MLFDLLLEAKDINLNQITNEDDTPLYFAMKMKPFNAYFASKLLAKGATPNPSYNTSGDTLLHILTRERREEAALFLTKYCQNNITKTNNDNSSVLHEACKVGLRDLTRVLLKNGLSTDIVTFSTGDTPIHFAISKQYTDIVIELLNGPASNSQLTIKNNMNDTPLSLAIKAPFKKGKDIVLALIKAGVNVNECNEEGLTLLHQAILKEDSATAIFLLENGADMNAK